MLLGATLASQGDRVASPFLHRTDARADEHGALMPGVEVLANAVGTILDSLTWGLLTALFLPTSDGATNGVMVAGMVGVASAGVLALSAHRVASGAALILVLGPLIEQQALPFPVFFPVRPDVR